jgi:PII-like signaling protein
MQLDLTGKTPRRQEMGKEMQIPREAVLLRIFFGENDRFHRLPLHEAIVLKAREMHLGGATVLRGHIGFGRSSRIHDTRFLRLSQDLPVVVEIVDSQEKIDRFLPVLDGMMSSGLITMERAEVLQYGTEEARPFQVVEQGAETPDLKA